jgi:hypothetical protein
MKINTANRPVFVNTERTSKPDYYVGADGSDEEFYDADGGTVTYSYVGANSAKDDIKAFQLYAISRGADLSYTIASGKNKGIRVTGNNAADGEWGAKTGDAYGKYGADFEKSVSGSPNVATVTSGVPNVPAGSMPTPTQLAEQKAKGVFWDKAKGVWIKAKDSGLLEKGFGFLAGLFGTSANAATPMDAPTDSGSGNSGSPDGKGMSTGLKIGIAVGVLVLVGVVIHSMSNNKK